MPVRIEPGALGAALGLLSFVSAGPAAACSVCLAGDPVFSNFGASAQAEGDVSVYLQLQGWRKTSGHAPHDEAAGARHAEHDDDHGPTGDASEANRSQRLDLFVSWTPIDRATFSLDLPWAFNRIVEREGEERTRSTLAGFGDASLAGSFVVWRDRAVLPASWVEARAFVKAPTGRDDAAVDGARDPHLQPGTGSWDFGAGLGVVRRLERASLYASAFYRENTEGALDYEYGDALLANAGLEVPLGHALGVARLARFTSGFELNFRYAGYDHEEGERFDQSGGAILYATPSLRVQLPGLRAEAPPSLRLAVQIPLTQSWLHQEQREEEVWSVGLLVPF